MSSKNLRKNYFRRSLIVVLTLMLVFTSAFVKVAPVYAGTNLAMKDGAILHAWCWNFNTIKNNMAAISDAGYTSIQTSPISKCLVGDSGNMKLNDWYYHYQPTDLTIGNYQLGTEAEFQAMCTTAHQYGIKIIVDVVANHVTSDYNSISSTVKNISGGAFHNMIQISDYNNRQQVTQYSLLGLYDFNTQNTNVQSAIKTYLAKCISDGADGFRFDAAKHIELPTDASSYASNFWPNVITNDGAQFQYGEILQDSITNSGQYANYMNVTASDYGNSIRTAICNNNVSAANLQTYPYGVDTDKLVTWVESHDNYANDSTTSQWMTDEQITLAWAIVAGRDAGAPLFFDRPLGGGGTTSDNRFPGKNQIGTVGSALYMGSKIKAINLFRNAMNGKTEYLRNPNSSTQVLMIERGTKGMIIVNMSNYSYILNSVPTNLANNTYTDKITNSSKFTVSGGNISGTIPARGVVVLY